MADALPDAPAGTAGGDRILVVLQLSGGNDGLNTVVPYADPLYRAHRAEIGVPDAQVLPLDDHVGLHPGLAGVKGLFDQGKVAVLQGVGYPNPSRSHFRSMEIWHTAAPDREERYGWVGRYLDSNPALLNNALAGINIGVEAPKAVAAQRAAVLSVTDVDHFGIVSAHGYKSAAQNPEELVREIEQEAGTSADSPAETLVQQTTLTAFRCEDKIREGAKNYHSTVVYPERNPVASGFQQVAKLLAANLGTRVFYLSTGGFDTHSREKDQHDLLMGHLDAAITAFYQDLQQMGMADRVSVITFSEFGRRVQENAGGGTDHGTAGPMFVIGNGIKGGIHGAPPSLADLDHGDLKFETDFRSVYATMLQQWLGADPGRILGADFQQIPMLMRTG